MDDSFEEMEIFSTPVPPARRRLRRRILLIVLGLAFLPALVTLISGTAFSLAAIRSYAIEQARNEVFTQAERLGDQIQSEAALLRGIATDARNTGLFAELANAEVTSFSNPFRARLDAIGQEFSPREFFLFEESGYLGRLARGGFRPDMPFPSAAAAKDILLTIETHPPEGLFLIQFPAESSLEFWMVARVRGDEEGSESRWLATRMDSEQFFRTATISRNDSGERPMIASSVSGPVGAYEEQSEIRRLIDASPDLFTESRGIFPVPGTKSSVYATMRIGAVNSLTRATGHESALVVLRRVELDAPTAALLYRVWQIALFFIVFMALVGAFGMWLSNRLVNPITKLRSGFQRLEAGDLDYRLTLRTDDELEDLASSMNQMAATLQQTYQSLANNLLELDEKAKQLAITHEIAQATNRSLDMETLFKDLVTAIMQLVPSEYVLLGLLTEGKTHVDLAYMWPVHEWNLGKDGQMDLQDSLSQDCIRAGTVGVYPLRKDAASPEERALASTEANALCVVPLISTAGPVAVLLLADVAEGAFRRQEIEVLERVSPSLAAAVEHCRLYAKQSEFATELERQVQERTLALRRAQEQLVQTEKLAATGELAANVAHEINNPLSIIKNYLQLIQNSAPLRTLGDSEKDSPWVGVKIIGEEIDRIARIVEQLRKVNAPSSPDLMEIDLEADLSSLLQLFRQTFHQKKIDVTLTHDPGLKIVILSRDFLRQILINLLRNAYDAADIGGKITITTHVDSPEPGFFTIRVRDSGPGIAPEHMTRIFDPFFTTKKEKGTGLGLSVSYGLARNMGGRIDAGNHPEGGAELIVTLPIRPQDLPAAVDASPSVRRHGGKIIIG
ncbi:hypothetical protein BH09SUM1_BH09SUM1_27530 [soil metagenome]